MGKWKSRAELDVEFVGKKYINQKGGICTVLPWGGVRDKHSARVYEVTCSTCSLDTELYPEGFTSCTKSLRKNSVPCGCSGNYKWNKEQYRILVERKLLSLSDSVTFSFQGDGKVSGKTFVCIGCKEHPMQTKRVKMSRILSEVFTIPCTECNRLSNISETKDSEIIRKFYEAGDFKGYKFTRNFVRRGENGSLIYWDYTCPVCSNDKYVQNGLCNGIFTAQIHSIREGSKSCRCSGVYPWTKEQRAFQIKEECDNGTKEYQTVYSQGGGGLMPKRLEDKDFLYILLCKDNASEFIKVGRSVDVDERIKALSKKSGTDIRCIAKYTSTHFQIYGLEQGIHYILKSLGRHYPVHWTVEGFTKDSLPVIESILNTVNLPKVC